MPLLPATCRPETAALALNPRVRASASPAARAILDEAGFEAARTAIRSWPGSKPTPLRRLDGLARVAGLRAIFLKDESGRFGLGSFKALGGGFAVARAVESRGPGITVTCATDGNHGRAVAWGAARAGCGCVIFVHEGVSVGRRRAIEAFGAEVRVVSGTYDDAVRRSAEVATAEGWVLVSDTSWEGYEAIPRDVMQGYAVMAEEALDQLAGVLPTHVFLQGGVGGLAAAVAARLDRRFGPERPRIVVVEPDRAACLLESCRAGRPVAVEDDLATVMAGLACGEPSLLAWRVLDELAHAFLAITDHAAVAVMRLLAEGVGGDPPLVIGESGVAGLAGALAAAGCPALAEPLGLGPESRVLVIGTEGATDAEVWRAIVGRAPEEVVARRGGEA
ncbi:MAG: diaminopropionate ammonia-lyase [Geminicoccaceae bacterium]|nr:diaminopropionate ammonia-lyase [Geminicoccaceae bacterium]